MRNLHDLERAKVENEPETTENGWAGVISLAIVCATIAALVWIIWGGC